MSMTNMVSLFSKVQIAPEQFSRVSDSLGKDAALTDIRATLVAPVSLTEDIKLFKQTFRLGNGTIIECIKSSGILQMDDIMLLEFTEVVRGLALHHVYKRLGASQGRGYSFISIYPVSTLQFKSFCQATAYTTTAEYNNADFTFMRKPGDSDLDEAEWHLSPARYLDPTDATNYCQWSGLDLPVESEWLDASILDQRILDDNDDLAIAYIAKRRLQESPFALRKVGCEIVLTDDRSSSLVRCGPSIVVCSSDKRRDEKVRYTENEGAMLDRQFRVCIRA